MIEIMLFYCINMSGERHGHFIADANLDRTNSLHTSSQSTQIALQAIQSCICEIDGENALFLFAFISNEEDITMTIRPENKV